MRIPGYGSIYNLGHKAVRDIFEEDVVVQEKVDGSQISFGVFHQYDEQGACAGDDVLRIRSKGSDIFPEAPDKMFAKAVEQIKSRQSLLRPGYTYRGEYLAKPKHNVLAYDRAPIGNIVLFDVDQGLEDYLSPQDLATEALRVGLESVPLLWWAKVPDITAVRLFLDMQSFLGGQKVEGIVVKNYQRFTLDKKIMMAKFVSESFKEVHSAEWKADNPGRKDILAFLTSKYRTPARWAKAVQHLREAGKLIDAPQDIGLLIREVPLDIEREERDQIVESLYSFFWPQIRRGVTAGIAEWYKEELLKLQFTKEEEAS